MKSFLLAAALLVAGAATARAQSLMNTALEIPAFESPEPVFMPPGTTIGPRAGYLKQRGADSGTWFYGVQMRSPISNIASIEASIEWHSNEFDGGDTKVLQYPIEATLIYYLYPGRPMNWYLLGGGGWYYTRTKYSGIMALTNSDSTENIFGAHMGLGVEMGSGRDMKISADVRYIYLKPSGALKDEKFDTIQFTFGLNFPF